MESRSPVLSCQLPAFLDSAAVSAIRGQVALHPACRAVLLEASRVDRFDPVGVLRLWDLCRDQTRRGIRMELVHLHPAMSRRLRSHPLRDYLSEGEGLFQDPFADLAVSER